MHFLLTFNLWSRRAHQTQLGTQVLHVSLQHISRLLHLFAFWPPNLQLSRLHDAFLQNFWRIKPSNPRASFALIQRKSSFKWFIPLHSNLKPSSSYASRPQFSVELSWTSSQSGGDGLSSIAGLRKWITDIVTCINSLMISLLHSTCIQYLYSSLLSLSSLCYLYSFSLMRL